MLKYRVHKNRKNSYMYILNKAKKGKEEKKVINLTTIYFPTSFCGHARPPPSPQGKQ